MNARDLSIALCAAVLSSLSFMGTGAFLTAAAMLMDAPDSPRLFWIITFLAAGVLSAVLAMLSLAVLFVRLLFAAPVATALAAVVAADLNSVDPGQGCQAPARERAWLRSADASTPD